MLLHALSYLLPVGAFLVAAGLSAHHRNRADQLEIKAAADASRKMQLAADVVHLARVLRFVKKSAGINYDDPRTDAILDEVFTVTAQCRAEGRGTDEAIERVLARCPATLNRVN